MPALAVFRRKMEAGADKTESQLAAGKHTFLKRWTKTFRGAFFIVWDRKYVAQGNSHKKII